MTRGSFVSNKGRKKKGSCKTDAAKVSFVTSGLGGGVVAKGAHPRQGFVTWRWSCCGPRSRFWRFLVRVHGGLLRNTGKGQIGDGFPGDCKFFPAWRKKQEKKTRVFSRMPAVSRMESKLEEKAGGERRHGKGKKKRQAFLCMYLR